MEKVERIARKVDMFGIPVSLNFSRDTKYKSSLGIFMSFCCIIALVAYVILGPLAPLLGFKKREFTYIASTVHEE